MAIKWADQVPSGHGYKGVRVYSIPSGAKWWVVLLDQVLGVWTHYVKDGERGRTRPCRDDCPYCPARPRYKAYAPALIRQRNLKSGEWHWVQGVIELTEGPADVIVNRKCRGLVVELSRSGQNARGALQLVVCPKQQLPPELNPLAEAFDVRPILYKMWGLDDEQQKELKPQTTRPTIHIEEHRRRERA
jgi:hypothetical protein